MSARAQFFDAQERPVLALDDLCDCSFHQVMPTKAFAVHGVVGHKDLTAVPATGMTVVVTDLERGFGVVLLGCDVAVCVFKPDGTCKAAGTYTAEVPLADYQRKRAELEAKIEFKSDG